MRPLKKMTSVLIVMLSVLILSTAYAQETEKKDINSSDIMTECLEKNCRHKKSFSSEDALACWRTCRDEAQEAKDPLLKWRLLAEKHREERLKEQGLPTKADKPPPRRVERPKQEKVTGRNLNLITQDEFIEAFLEAALPPKVIFINGDEEYFGRKTTFAPDNEDHQKLFEEKGLPLPGRVIRWPAQKPISVILKQYGPTPIPELYDAAKNDAKVSFNKILPLIEDATSLSFEILNDEPTIGDTPKNTSSVWPADIVFLVDVSGWTNCFTPRSPRKLPYEGDHEPSVGITLGTGKIRKVSQNDLGDYEIRDTGIISLNNSYQIKSVVFNKCSGSRACTNSHTIEDLVAKGIFNALGLPDLLVNLDNYELELAFLRALYHPYLQPGMTAEEVREKLPKIIKDLEIPLAKDQSVP